MEAKLFRAKFLLFTRGLTMVLNKKPTLLKVVML